MSCLRVCMFIPGAFRGRKRVLDALTLQSQSVQSLLVMWVLVTKSGSSGKASRPLKCCACALPTNSWLTNLHWTCVHPLPLFSRQLLHAIIRFIGNYIRSIHSFIFAVFWDMISLWTRPVLIGYVAVICPSLIVLAFQVWGSQACDTVPIVTFDRENTLSHC